MESRNIHIREGKDMRFFEEVGVRIGLAFASLRDLREERGQTFTEYAVLLGVLLVGVSVAIIFLRGAIISGLDTIANDI
jgi:Flp pilus assembly pilin Flp